ncbi:MAG: hypothetical protein ACMUIU_15610 [bacterium]
MKKKIIISFSLLLLFSAWIRVAGAQINILGEMSHEKKARPGETYEGEIIIKNRGQGIEEVKIYQTDYLFSCEGGSTYGEPGKIPRSNAPWIKFRPNRLKIGPKQQESIHYVVKTPRDESLVGTYWSILMIEPISKDSPESSQSKENDVAIGVRQIFRYGVQIATHIGNTGVGMLMFLDTKLLKEKEERILKVDVENIGETFLRPSLSVELFNENGTHVGRYKAGPFRTYPGTSVRFEVDLGQIAEGIYKALVVADCGGENVFGGTYNLKIQNKEKIAENIK